MNKEIKFLMKFDTSEFDRAIEKMQRQLKEVYRPADMVGAQRKTEDRLEGLGLGGGNKPGVEAYFKSIQNSRREMDSLIQKYSKDQQSLIKDLAAHEEHQKKLKRAQDEVIKGSQEELRLARELKLVEEQTFRMRESWMQRNQVINQAVDARQNLGPKDKLERLMTAFGGGGMKGGMGEAATMGGEWWKGLGMTGQAGAIIGGLLAAAKGSRMIGNAYAGYNKMPLDIAAAQGSATSNIYGREVSSIYSGNQISEMGFMNEKQGAADMAGTAQKAQRARDMSLSATGMAGAGFRAGMGNGHAIFGAIGGATLGIVNDLFDQRSRAYDLSKLPGGIGKRYGEKFESMQAEEYASNYAKAVEDLKAQNPLKKAATEQFNQRYMSDLQFQRSTGLNYEGFSGANGLKMQAINSGFTGDMGMDAASGILAGGGSTRGAQGLGVLSMQAQRGYDLTNANGIIGKLSGQMGDNESTRQAFVTMLAESTKLGLDSSQFREENRRFMDAAGKIVEESGTTSQSGIASLMSMFGDFVGQGTTTKGVEAGQTAFETYNKGTSATSGAQGVMRASNFLKDAALNKIDGPDMAALAGIDMEHLAPDHPVVKYIADKYFQGDAGKVVGLAKKAGQNSFHRMKKGDDLQSKLTDLRDQLQKTPGMGAGEYIRNNLQKQISSTENEYATTLALEYPQLANDPQALKKLAQGTTQPGGKSLSEEEVKKTLENKNTGRPEDAAVQAAAEGSRLMVENFQKFHDTIVPTVEAVKAFNSELVKTIDNIMKMPKSEQLKALQNNPLIQAIMPKNQAQPNSGEQK